jgi:hypothetical protein
MKAMNLEWVIASRTRPQAVTSRRQIAPSPSRLAIANSRFVRF